MYSKVNKNLKQILNFSSSYLKIQIQGYKSISSVPTPILIYMGFHYIYIHLENTLCISLGICIFV